MKSNIKKVLLGLIMMVAYINISYADMWYVEAKCSVPIKRGDGQEEMIFIFGKGKGKTYEAACKAAKSDVDKVKPAGSGQKKHCRCLENPVHQKNKLLIDLLKIKGIENYGI